MKKFWEDFKKFIKRGNVIDMAVGVAVASAFTAIVTAFTKGFINPLLALISKDSTQEELKWILREEIIDPVTETVTQTEVAILWGSFLQAIINFLIVALTLFTIVRIVSAVSAHSAKLRQSVIDKFSDEDEKLAEAEAKAKAEAEEAARLEAEAKAAEEAAAKAKIEEEENRKKREEALLVEICSLLKELNAKK